MAQRQDDARELLHTLAVLAKMMLEWRTRWPWS